MTKVVNEVIPERRIGDVRLEAFINRIASGWPRAVRILSGLSMYPWARRRCLAVSLLDDEGTKERTDGRTDGSAADVRIPYSRGRERERVCERETSCGNEKLGEEAINSYQF